MSTSKPTSLLGGPYPPELEAKRAKERAQEQQMVARVSVWKDLLLEAYSSGELSFEQYAKLCRTIISANTVSKPNARNRWLGEAIDAALDAKRENRGRGQRGTPKSIRVVALDTLEMIHKTMGLPLSRASDNAYEKCCELFTTAGYGSISPTELEKWWGEAKSTRVKD